MHASHAFMEKRDPRDPVVLLGVAPLPQDEALPDGWHDFHRGKIGWQQEVMQRHKGVIPDADLQRMLLKLPEITRRAAAGALRRSASLKRGEHLCLEKPDMPELKTDVPTTLEIDPRHTHYARLQEAMAFARENAEVALSDLLSDIRLSVEAVAAGDLDLAGVYMERVLIESANMWATFQRQRLVGNESVRSEQTYRHRETIKMVIEEAMTEHIQREAKQMGSVEDVQRFLELMNGMIGLYLQPPSKEAGQRM